MATIFNMSEIHERFKQARDKAGLTQQDVATHFDISRVSVTNWESGKTKPDMDKIPQLALLFKVSIDWLMSGKGHMSTEHKTKPRLVSSYDPDGPDTPDHDDRMSMGSETGFNGAPEGSSPQIDITAGMGAGGLSITNEGVPGKHGMTFSAESVKDYWKLPPAILVTLGLAAQDIAIFPVQGDSMQPTLDEGDVVFIDTRHRRPSPDGLYAIIDEIGGLAIKRLEISSDPGADDALVSVISDNPRHKTKIWRAADLYIVGRVLRKFSTVR